MLALEQLLSGVNDLVPVQVGLPGESRVATRAHVRLFARVDALMADKMRRRRERGRTLVALILLLARVTLRVLRQISLVVEFPRTILASEGAFLRVGLDVAGE